MMKQRCTLRTREGRWGLFMVLVVVFVVTVNSIDTFYKAMDEWLNLIYIVIATILTKEFILPRVLRLDTLTALFTAFNSLVLLRIRELPWFIALSASGVVFLFVFSIVYLFGRLCRRN